MRSYLTLHIALYSQNNYHINYLFQICNAQCSIFCSTIECCNVARCDAPSKTCIAGRYENAADTGTGDEHMITNISKLHFMVKFFVDPEIFT